MADNVAITAGSGTGIATDEVSGTLEHVQLFKLAIATDGSRTLVPADGTDGLLVNLGTNNDVAVTGTVAVTQSGTWDEVGINDSGNSITVDNGGTFAVQAAGDVAHDTADSGSPVKIGAKAVSHGANPTSVTANDRTDIYANRAGVQFVIGGHPNVLTLKHADITTAVTNASIVAGSANVRIVVTRLTVTLDSASTVFPLVRIGFAAATTPTTTGVIASHGGVPAGGGFTIGDGSGIVAVSAAGDALLVTTTGAATGAGVHITVSYYTINEA